MAGPGEVRWNHAPARFPVEKPGPIEQHHVYPVGSLERRLDADDCCLEQPVDSSGLIYQPYNMSILPAGKFRLYA